MSRARRARLRNSSRICPLSPSSGERGRAEGEGNRGLSDSLARDRLTEPEIATRSNRASTRRASARRPSFSSAVFSCRSTSELNGLICSAISSSACASSTRPSCSRYEATTEWQEAFHGCSRAQRWARAGFQSGSARGHRSSPRRSSPADRAGGSGTREPGWPPRAPGVAGGRRPSTCRRRPALSPTRGAAAGCCRGSPLARGRSSPESFPSPG